MKFDVYDYPDWNKLDSINYLWTVMAICSTGTKLVLGIIFGWMNCKVLHSNISFQDNLDLLELKDYFVNEHSEFRIYTWCNFIKLLYL